MASLPELTTVPRNRNSSKDGKEFHALVFIWSSLELDTHLLSYIKVIFPSFCFHDVHPSNFDAFWANWVLMGFLHSINKIIFPEILLCAQK